MKTKLHSLIVYSTALTLLSALSSQLTPALAQGTAFTYQGRLSNGTNPVTGLYDLRFHIYDSASGGSVLGGPVTNTAVPVTNGLFTVVMDMGAGVLPGSSDGRHIGVRSNGGGNFTGLSPRVLVTPTPNAIYAETANAAGLSGSVPAADLVGVSGTGLTGVSLLAGGNTFSGNQVIDGQLKVSDGGGATSPPYNDIIVGPGGYNNFEEHNVHFDDPAGHIGSLTVGFNNTGGENSGGYFSVGNLWYNGHVTGTKAFSVLASGNVNVDPMDMNSGALNNGNTNSSGLTFGAGSGEGIASERVPGANQYGLDFYTSFNQRLSIDNSGNLWIPSDQQTIHFPATGGANNPMMEMFSSGTQNADRMVIAHSPSFPNWGLQYQDYQDRFNFLASGIPVMTVYLSGQSVGIGTTNPTAKLEVNGNARVDGGSVSIQPAGTVYSTDGLVWGNGGLPGINAGADSPFLAGYLGGALGAWAPNTVCLSWDAAGDCWVSNNLSTATLTIRGGADLAEPFNITSGKDEVPQGSVVVIDDQNPGHLKLSDTPYDTRVAGVISGANGVNPGIQMHQQGILEGGKNVALTGRVYVQADASNGAIHPGDMLTTSSTPGHAMKVSDHTRSVGAILGKAMTGLSEGKGMVLVLVTLQ